MKIVFNTDQIYLHGGIEKVMAEKANYFADILNYEVTIITTEQQDRLPCYQLSSKIKLIDLGINYHREKSYLNKANIAKIPRHFLQLRKTLKALNPDVLIVVNFAFDFYWLPFFLKKIIKIREFHYSRYFLNKYRSENQSTVNRLKYKVNDWIESKYDALILLNPDEKIYYNTSNTVVLPNPISIPTETAKLQRKQVIAAGRIARVKGFDQLVRAWEIVHKQEPEWELHIYGEAYLDTKMKLEELIKSLELENVVIIKDSVDDIPTTMLDYSICAMSSITEGFPMVLLEAQSVGLPIVSYDCPNGPRHIVNHNIDGLLVTNQQPIELAKSLLCLMQDEYLRKKMGENAKANSKNFLTHKVMQHWLQLFNTIIKI